MSSPRIPEEIGRIYGPLSDELLNVLFVWESYKELFDGTQERVDFLSRHGTHFFAKVQQCFGNEAILGIARMLDQARIGKFSNVSLKALVDAVELHEWGLPAKLGMDQKLTEIETHCEPFVSHRMKRLAHNDLTRSLKAAVGQDDLPKMLRVEIDRAVPMIGDFLNLVSIHFGHGANIYKIPTPLVDDAGALVEDLLWLEHYWSTYGKPPRRPRGYRINL